MKNEISKLIRRNALNPFGTFNMVDTEFDRLFNDWMSRTAATNTGWLAPSCDIVETEGRYLLKFDMPGVQKENIKVEINDRQLTVSAERKNETKCEDKSKYLCEIEYGSYVRSFTLPEKIDEKKIEAKFENGVLSLTVPKTEILASKQVPVH